MRLRLPPHARLAGAASTAALTALAGCGSDAKRPELAERWRVAAPAPATGAGSAAVASDGRAVVGLAGNTVYGVDPSRHRIRWQRSVPSPFGRPVIAGSVVLQLSSTLSGSDRAADRITALDVRSGRVRWSRPWSRPAADHLGSRLGTPIAVAGGRVYLVERDGLLALDRRTGEQRRSWRSRTALLGTVVTAGGRVVVLDERNVLHGLGAALTPRWRRALVPGGSSPFLRVSASDILVAWGGAERLRSFKGATGRQRWSVVLPEASRLVDAARNGSLLVLAGAGSANNAIGLDAETGRVSWRRTLALRPAHVVLEGDNAVVSGTGLVDLGAGSGEIRATSSAAPEGAPAAFDSGVVFPAAGGVVAIDLLPFGG